MVLFYNQFFKNAFGEVVPYNNNLIMIFQVILLVNVGRFQHIQMVRTLLKTDCIKERL